MQPLFFAVHNMTLAQIDNLGEHLDFLSKLGSRILHFRERHILSSLSYIRQCCQVTCRLLVASSYEMAQSIVWPSVQVQSALLIPKFLCFDPPVNGDGDYFACPLRCSCDLIAAGHCSAAGHRNGSTRVPQQYFTRAQECSIMHILWPMSA